MQFSYSQEGDNYEVANILPSRKKGCPSAPMVWPKIHHSMQKIQEAKKDDLLSLCRSGLIPQEYHAWFNSLEVCTNENSANEKEEESDVMSINDYSYFVKAQSVKQ
uniref:Uncharacterized protein n=1 Tax=Romanomermis culicivorax TaxID=13658 RepID=A0A915INI6_ROMCU